MRDFCHEVVINQLIVVSAPLLRFDYQKTPTSRQCLEGKPHIVSPALIVLSSFPFTTPQLRQDGLRVLILWLQALQNNAGDASMQLFASAVPHFPPQKTPLGLPSAPSSSSFHPHLSTHSLVERYGTYSSRDGAGLLSRRASSASVCGVRGIHTIRLGSGEMKKEGDFLLAEKIWLVFLLFSESFLGLFYVGNFVISTNINFAMAVFHTLKRSGLDRE